MTDSFLEPVDELGAFAFEKADELRKEVFDLTNGLDRFDTAYDLQLVKYCLDCCSEVQEALTDLKQIFEMAK